MVTCFWPPGAAKGHGPRKHTHKHTHTKQKPWATQAHTQASCPRVLSETVNCWAEARVKIARMTLTIKLDGNWSSFQLANCAPPLGVTDSAIAPSARMLDALQGLTPKLEKKRGTCLSNPFGSQASLGTHLNQRRKSHKQPEPKAILNA